MWAMRFLSEVARISFPTAIRLKAVSGWKGRMFVVIHDWAEGSFVSEGMSLFATVTVTEMLVLAKARRMSGFASKSLIRSMVVWVLRNEATVEGGGRLSAMVP